MEVKTQPTPLQEQYKGTKCDAPGCLVCGNEDCVDFTKQEQENFGNFNFKSSEN